MTVSSNLGMLYCVDHHPHKPTSYMCVSDDFVPGNIEFLPYDATHEKKIGHVVHCYAKDMASIENADSLDSKILKVRTCMEEISRYKTQIRLKVGVALADHEIERDRELLKKLERARKSLKHI